MEFQLKVYSAGDSKVFNEFEATSVVEAEPVEVASETISPPSVTTPESASVEAMPTEMSPAQLLYSVVAQNVENPENRIKLSPEQGKEVMKDFVDFVAGSSETPTNEDGRTKTFNELDDNELLKCLSEYLGSGISNTSINGTMIESAQELIAEQYMSEDELEDLPNPKTENGRQARERKLLEKIRDAAEDERKQLQENRDKWDNDTHDYGGEQLTGAEIMQRIDWFSKKANQEKVRQDLVKKGATTKEADEIIAKMLERDALLKRQRDGIPPLTAAETARLAMLNKDDGVVQGGLSQLAVMPQTQTEKALVAKLETAEVVPIKAVNDADVVLAKLTEHNELMKRQRDGTVISSGEKERLAMLNKDEEVIQAASMGNSLRSQAEVGKEFRQDATQSKLLAVGTIDKDVSASSSSKEAYAHFNTAPAIKEAFVVAANDPVYDTVAPMPAIKPATAISTSKLNNDVAALM